MEYTMKESGIGADLIRRLSLDRETIHETKSDNRLPVIQIAQKLQLVTSRQEYQDVDQA